MPTATDAPCGLDDVFVTSSTHRDSPDIESRDRNTAVTVHPTIQSPFLGEDGFEDNMEFGLLITEPDASSTPRSSSGGAPESDIAVSGKERQKSQPRTTHAGRKGHSGVTRAQNSFKNPAKEPRHKLGQVDELSLGISNLLRPLAPGDQNRIIASAGSSATLDGSMQKHKLSSSLAHAKGLKKPHILSHAARRGHMIRPANASANGKDELQ